MRGILRRIADWLLDFEHSLLDPSIPDTWKRVDYTHLAELLIDAFPFAEKIYLSDEYTYLCPIEELQEFLSLDDTDKQEYITEIFDCDDFAFRLIGQFHKLPYSALAVGIAWSDVHAFNVIAVDSNDKVWIIEPQTDELLDPKTIQDEAYEVKLIWM